MANELGTETTPPGVRPRERFVKLRLLLQGLIAWPKTWATSPQATPLGASVSGALADLQKDLEGAGRAPMDSQAELAQLRDVLSRTRQHLARLQISINELREERHRLGNEAMQTQFLRHKLQVATTECAKLREERLRQLPRAGEAEMLRHKLDAVTAERDRLRRELESRHRSRD